MQGWGFLTAKQTNQPWRKKVRYVGQFLATCRGVEKSATGQV